MVMIEPDRDESLRVVIDDLTKQFSELDPSEVQQVATDEFETLAATAKVPTFLGILSARRARERLESMARHPTGTSPHVLDEA